MLGGPPLGIVGPWGPLLGFWALGPLLGLWGPLLGLWSPGAPSWDRGSLGPPLGIGSPSRAPSWDCGSLWGPLLGLWGP